MNLQINFEPNISDPRGCRLVLKVGDASIRSYPMSADDHYRDLFAIKHFLCRRTLSSIMLGDEPVGALEYSGEGDLITLTPYGGPGQKVISSTFRLNQALSHIDDVLHELSDKITTDKTSLERQVIEDIDAGVYDPMINRL